VQEREAVWCHARNSATTALSQGELLSSNYTLLYCLWFSCILTKVSAYVAYYWRVTL
jgi:hypothetical protein